MSDQHNDPSEDFSLTSTLMRLNDTITEHRVETVKSNGELKEAITDSNGKLTTAITKLSGETDARFEKVHTEIAAIMGETKAQFESVNGRVRSLETREKRWWAVALAGITAALTEASSHLFGRR